MPYTINGTLADGSQAPIKIGSDGGLVMTSSSTATVTTVASAAVSTVIKAANTLRRGLTISNTDANILYVLLGGGTASATNFTYAIPGATATVIGYYEVPYGFTGAISGIWAVDGTGSAIVTEIT